MIDHTFKIRVVNVQKVIEVPRCGIESLDNTNFLLSPRIKEKGDGPYRGSTLSVLIRIRTSVWLLNAFLAFLT